MLGILSVISGISAIGVMGYYYNTTPEQRNIHYLGYELTKNRIKDFMGPERDELINKVELTLYYIKNKKPNVKVFDSRAFTLQFIEFFENNERQLKNYDFEELIKSKEFSNYIPQYNLLLDGELMISYIQNNKIYNVIFKCKDNITFPIYYTTNKRKRRFVLEREMIMESYLLNSNNNTKIDVTETIIKFAGPDHDFYKNNKNVSYKMDILRMFWEYSDKITDGFDTLCIISNKYKKYWYDLNEEIYIEWPKN